MDKIKINLIKKFLSIICVSSFFSVLFCTNGGLQNLGNTCFKNSSIQLLSQISELREYLLKDKKIAYENLDTTINPDTDVDDKKIVIEFINILEMLRAGKVVSPSEEFDDLIDKRFFKERYDTKENIKAFLLAGAGRSEINIYPEEDDAAAFILAIFVCLSKPYLGLDVPGTLKTTILTLTRCKICGNTPTDTSTEPFLALPIQANDIVNCLKKYIEPEGILYGCSQCLGNYNATKKIPEGSKIVQENILSGIQKGKIKDILYVPATQTKNVLGYPKALLLSLKRFREEAKNKYEKDSTAVSFPMQDLDFNGNLYELRGFICHSGTLKGGHYIAYTKDFDSDKWVFFSDSSVIPKTEEDIKKIAETGIDGPNTPYIFYYKKTQDAVDPRKIKEIEKSLESELKNVDSQSPQAQAAIRAAIKSGLIKQEIQDIIFDSTFDNLPPLLTPVIIGALEKYYSVKIADNKNPREKIQSLLTKFNLRTVFPENYKNREQAIAFAIHRLYADLGIKIVKNLMESKNKCLKTEESDLIKYLIEDFDDALSSPLNELVNLVEAGLATKIFDFEAIAPMPPKPTETKTGGFLGYGQTTTTTPPTFEQFADYFVKQIYFDKNLYLDFFPLTKDKSNITQILQAFNLTENGPENIFIKIKEFYNLLYKSVETPVQEQKISLDAVSIVRLFLQENILEKRSIGQFLDSNDLVWLINTAAIYKQKIEPQIPLTPLDVAHRVAIPEKSFNKFFTTVKANIESKVTIPAESVYSKILEQSLLNNMANFNKLVIWGMFSQKAITLVPSAVSGSRVKLDPKKMYEEIYARLIEKYKEEFAVGKQSDILQKINTYQDFFK